MTTIRVFVQDRSAKSVSVKALRPILPSVGLSEILRRVDAGEPVAEAVLFAVSHDEAVATLRAVVVALQNSGVAFRIVKVLSDITLVGGGPKQRVESDISADALHQLLAQFEEIRQEQQTLAELEDEVD